MPHFSSTCVSVVQIPSGEAEAAIEDPSLYKAVRTNSLSKAPSGEVLQINSRSSLDISSKTHSSSFDLEIKQYNIVKIQDPDYDARAKLAWSCTEQDDVDVRITAKPRKNKKGSGSPVKAFFRSLACSG